MSEHNEPKEQEQNEVSENDLESVSGGTIVPFVWIDPTILLPPPTCPPIEIGCEINPDG